MEMTKKDLRKNISHNSRW